MEGVVVRFDDGHMFKIKTEWYCAIHRAKEDVLWEKNVVRLVLEEKLDDIIVHLPDEDRVRLEAYQQQLLGKVDFVCKLINDSLKLYFKGMSRKDFALNVAPTLDKFLVQLIFTCWANTNDIRKEVIRAYIKKTSSNKDLESIRDYIGKPWVPVDTTVEDFIEEKVA